MTKRYFAIAAVSGVASYFGYKIYKAQQLKQEAIIFKRRPALDWKPPSREETIKYLKSNTYDLLIIGGGSAGAGCALDATTRGLKVCLIESGDFASQTSSKSTKLLHGGIRYLEKAFKKLDIRQFFLVKEALAERKTVMTIAPFLSEKLTFMLPVYNKLMIPYFFIGLKFYDWISGSKSLGPSMFLNRNEVLKEFPAVKKKNLAGAVLYYDGQFNDAKLNVLIAMTANYYGATVANYINADSFVFDENKIRGAHCTDKQTKKKFVIWAKGVINAAGPYIDDIRKMDDTQCKEITAPSSGVHLILPSEYAPKGTGLVLPSTSDGRVLFFIPWQGKALVGTTDNNCKARRDPVPSEEEINFIVDEIRNNVRYPEMLKPKNVLAAWSGIRPLVRDPTKNSEALVRNHLITISPGNLITLSGGKWTTYRKMAEETIDTAIKTFKLKTARNCVTNYVKILGSHSFDEGLYLRLERDMNLDCQLAKHLANNYGDRVYKFRNYIKTTPKKLHSDYDFLREEVEYCIDNEMALTISDILARRMRLAFIDVKAAEKCVPIVSYIMKNKLKWSESRRKDELRDAFLYLKTMGIDYVKSNT